MAIRDDGNLTRDLSLAVRCETADAAEAAEAVAEHMARLQGYVAGSSSHVYDPQTRALVPAEVANRCGDVPWCPERKG